MSVEGAQDKENRGGREVKEDGEEEETEERYGLFGYAAVKSVWRDQRAILKDEKLEGGDEDQEVF